MRAMLAALTSRFVGGVVLVSATATYVPSGDQSGCVAYFIAGRLTLPSETPFCALYSLSAPLFATRILLPSGENVAQPIGRVVLAGMIGESEPTPTVNRSVDGASS